MTRENLANTASILQHNIVHGVNLYRFSSKVFPLATHPQLSCWNYIDEMQPELMAIGEMVREYGIPRLLPSGSFHADQFAPGRDPVGIARRSPTSRSHVVGDGPGLQSQLVTHIGGGYNDKEQLMQRFLTNLKRAHPPVVHRLTLENDDKVFTAADVLNLCQDLSLPMVLDLHHHLCNRCEEKLVDMLKGIFQTWSDTGLRPKVHISSPRS